MTLAADFLSHILVYSICSVCSQLALPFYPRVVEKLLQTSTRAGGRQELEENLLKLVRDRVSTRTKYEAFFYWVFIEYHWCIFLNPRVWGVYINSLELRVMATPATYIMILVVQCIKMYYMKDLGVINIESGRVSYNKSWSGGVGNR